MEIRFLLDTSKAAISLAKVDGHQDDQSEFNYSTAPQEIQRNIDMDQYAKTFVLNPPPDLTPALQLSHLNILRDLRHHIILHHHGPDIKYRLLRTLPTTPHALKGIEWEGIEVSMSKLQTLDRIPRMKLMHMQYPAKAYLFDRNLSKSRECPRCSQQIEDFHHIYQCQSVQAKNIHRNTIRTIRTQLQKAKTAPLIIDAFANLLNSFHFNKRPSSPEPMLKNKSQTAAVDSVFEQQLLLGPTSIHRGFLTRNWMVVQNLCHNWENLQHKDLTWLKKIVTACWYFSHEIRVQRCQFVNQSDKSNPLGMSHCDLLSEIRTYTKIPKNELSTEERKLHFNVKRILRVAHKTTLIKWLDLLQTERESTIRRKREIRQGVRGYTRPLTAYFRKKPNPTKTNSNTGL